MPAGVEPPPRRGMDEDCGGVFCYYRMFRLFFVQWHWNIRPHRRAVFNQRKRTLKSHTHKDKKKTKEHQQPTDYTGTETAHLIVVVVVVVVVVVARLGMFFFVLFRPRIHRRRPRFFFFVSSSSFRVRAGGDRIRRRGANEKENN